MPQLSTITTVKHDLEIAVVSARRNCSCEVEDEQRVKLDGAVEARAESDCKFGWTEGKSAAAESACRQYGVVREVLLPEAELSGSRGIANYAERRLRTRNRIAAARRLRKSSRTETWTEAAMPDEE